MNIDDNFITNSYELWEKELKIEIGIIAAVAANINKYTIVTTECELSVASMGRKNENCGINDQFL